MMTRAQAEQLGPEVLAAWEQRDQIRNARVIRYTDLFDADVALIDALVKVVGEQAAAWEDLRGQMNRTAKVGIDIYVRGNAKDFLRMMDTAKEANRDHKEAPDGK